LALRSLATATGTGSDRFYVIDQKLTFFCIYDDTPAPSGSDATRAQNLRNASPTFAGRDAILVTASSDATRVRDLHNASPALTGRDAILASASSEDTRLHHVRSATIIGLDRNTTARFACEVPTPLSNLFIQAPPIPCILSGQR
jgi:hypothetical protein